MSTLLYRLGKTAFRKPGYFIIGWVLILGIVISMISINGIHISSEMKIEGTESQKVLDQLAKELPAASGGQGSVVFKAPDNERLDTPERLAAITKAVSEVYALKDVINPADYAAEASSSGATADMAQASNMQQQSAAASPPPYGPLMVDGVPVPGVLLSSDGKVALFQFQFTIEQSAITQDGFDSVIDSVMTAQQGTNITVLPGETLKTVAIGVGSAEIIGLIIAIIVLLITLGSVVAAGLPLVTALLGVAIGVGGAFSISKFIEMPSVTSVLALMVGLAVGIDYALFIVNRQRRMIIDQRLSAQEATARAIGTSGSAVFFAGLTVIIALCGMLVIGLTFLSTMALVAAATVLINVFVALTLLPALLGLVGERICSPKAREKSTKHPKTAGRGTAHRWVIKYRWITIIAIVVLLGAAATPITKMEMGIPGASSANLDTTARQGYDAISEGFGEGFNGPLILVAEPNHSSAQVTPELLGSLMQELQSQNNVAQVTPLGMTEDLAIFSLIPETGPNDKITKDLVNELRSTESSVAQTNDVKIGVTGFTAVNIDMSAKLAQVFPIYVGIIILLSLIILLLVFRSIIVPIKATIGFLLSILATFGITTAVFQWGWLHSLFGFDTGGPLLSFMPIIVTGILYGLAMDYQVFLVSSMRESYVHGHRGTESVVHGYNQVSRVVVAAAVIMVSVFAGFIFTDDVMIKQIGFTLAVGILIDAFIIRMGLVPAIMAIFGDKAWSLPKWLDRILPNLDVEGEKLIATLNAKDHSNSKS